MTSVATTKNRQLLLNADVGEGLETDWLLYPHLGQASIACGGHAGSDESMQLAVTACLENEVSIGAHPSYPDRANFGRVSVDLPPEQLLDSLREQLISLELICQRAGAELTYIKPHGALYNDLLKRHSLFILLLRLTAESQSTRQLMVQAGEDFAAKQIAAREYGVELLAEAFADRLYLSNGMLSPRSERDSVHQSKELIIQQASQLVTDGAVTTKSGGELAVSAQTLCLHGDNPASVDAVKQVAALLAA